MDKSRISYLHDRFLAGTLTSAERKEWQHVVDDPQMENQMLSLIENSWRQIRDNALTDMPETRSKEMVNYIVSNSQISRKSTRLWPRIIAIAAAVALIVSGIYFFSYKNQTENNNMGLVVQDVAPGRQGATLTLANGKKIRLTDAANGELANEAGVVISKSADGRLVYEIKDADSDPNKINTLSTAKGETYQVRLPDGSLVWLNAASSLTYSANLNEHGKRRVKLDGEGYFQVAKDKAHPFVVESKGQQVEVLGTEFNVNAYADEPLVATTLLEGSVKLIPSSGKETAMQPQILKPGEQALNNGKTIKVEEANIENITDWKEGDFYFERVDFRTVMRKIARWYDVEVIYDESVPDDIRSGGWMSRDNKLSAVLKSIEKSGQVHFRVDSRKIYVTK